MTLSTALRTLEQEIERVSGLPGGGTVQMVVHVPFGGNRLTYQVTVTRKGR